MDGFRQSHAVVIGINEYGNGIPKLRTAVSDARSIARVLKAGSDAGSDLRYDDIQLVTEDVTLKILRILFAESLPQQIQPDDRLFVYFAGHGIALEGDDGPAGYLVPQDARRDDRQTFLPMTDLSRWLDQLPCRHLLLVLDCCFAGAFRWSSTRDLGAPPDVIYQERYDRYIRDRAWQVITSAAYDQKALDVLVSGSTIGLRAPEATDPEHSPFAAAFQRALEGAADLAPSAPPGRVGGDGVITATELYVYLRNSVEVGAEQDGRRQTPGLWPLKKHDKGEYIHLVPGHELNLPPAPTLNETNNPYRGLQSYDEEHAPVFFGRSQFVQKLAKRVAERPLTVVLGASGTGKSSVVKAGLLSHLRATEPGAWHILAPIRPGKSPLASLASLNLTGEQVVDPGSPPAGFSSDSEALATRVRVWAARETAGRLLLVVDQFEELITLCTNTDERDQFLRLLDRALAGQPDRLRVVLTLRSDFEPQFARSPLEHEWMSSRIVVPTMTLDEYREVIEGPASAKVLYFTGKTSSQAFINRLIEDVANTPGALPLLSFTLSELYRCYVERKGDDRALTEDDYDKLGGVGGSLRNRASEVYDRLPDDDHRRTMRKVMLRMISLEGGELARRHVPDDELVYDSPDENRRVQEVIRRLTEARLVVEGKESDAQPFVEPAHDELVRGWDKLLQWSREESEGLQLRRRLAPAAWAWERGQAGSWATDPRLGVLHQILRSPADWLNAVETRFVRRSWFVRRAAQAAVAIAFLVLLVVTALALYERHLAVERDRTANSRRIAARSVAARDRRLDHALLLAVEAVTTKNIEPTTEARSALIDALLTRPEIETFLHMDEGDVQSLAFRPDGKVLAAGYDVYFGSSGGGVVLFDTTSRQRIQASPLAVPEGSVESLAFSPDGKVLAVGYGAHVGSSSSGVVLFHAASGQRLPTQPRPVTKGDVTSVAFSPDGEVLAAGHSGRDGGGGVMLFDLTSRQAFGNDRLAVIEGDVLSVAFSLDGKILAAGCTGKDGRGPGGGVVLFDTTSRQRIQPSPLAVPNGSVQSLAFSPDGKVLAAGGHGVVLFNASSRQRFQDKPTSVTNSVVSSVAFSPDGKVLAARLRRQQWRRGVLRRNQPPAAPVPATHPAGGLHPEHGLQPRRQVHRRGIRQLQTPQGRAALPHDQRPADPGTAPP